MQSQAADLAAALGERIAWLAPELLPNVVRSGNYLCVGSLAGEPGRSMVVFLAGRKRGRWFDYAAGEGGDALDLVRHLRGNGKVIEAMDWARRWLGRDDGEWRRPPRSVPSAGRAAKAIAEDLLLEQNRRRAMSIWVGAKPLAPGDLAWRYCADRGIDLGRLPRVPSALRFHPRLRNNETGQYLPAMVAIIADAAGHNCAVHRTWLAERNLACEDRPMVGKADLRNPKLTLGAFRGGWIRMWRGAGGEPWDRLRPGEVLVVSEGIEDLLSYLQIEAQWRAACAVSLSFMAVMELPPEFTEIRILAQRDPRMSADGRTVQLSPARRLLYRVATRWELEGRKVFIWTPPVFVKDFNELVQHRFFNATGARQ